MRPSPPERSATEQVHCPRNPGPHRGIWRVTVTHAPPPVILPAATTSSTSATLSLHRGFATVLLLYSLFIGLWSLFLWIRGSNPSRSSLGALAIPEGVPA